MTDQASPSQRVMDLLVYAPAGLLFTAMDELPQLADKGRRRVEGQVTTARVVGQFTLQLARQRLRHRLRAASPPPATPATSEPTGSAPLTADRPRSHLRTSTTSATPVPATPGASTSRTRPAPGNPVAPKPPEAPPASTPPMSPPATFQRRDAREVQGIHIPGGEGNPAGAGDLAGLAIPGYDSLSASQVVQRLPGLTKGELRRVLAHESAHRHRRTILNRAEHLLGGSTGPFGG